MSTDKHFDFQVYAQDDSPTGESVSQTARHQILTRVPDLASLKVFDGPYLCGPLYGWSSAIVPNRCWYAHVRTQATHNRLGRGRVIVIERTTGEIVYDGSDGGE